MQVGRRSVAAGQTIVVPVWIVTPTAITTVAFMIDFDRTVATIDDGFVGDFVKGVPLLVNTRTAGRLSASFTLAAPKSGSGTVVTVKFRGVGAPGASTPLRLTVTSATDGSGATVPVDRIDGSVTIIGGPPATGCKEAGGDNALVAMCALRMSVELTPTNQALDLDGDHEITSHDAQIVLARAHA